MSGRAMQSLTFTDLLTGRASASLERYRAVLGVASETGLLGVGWATVDLERTLANVASTVAPAAAENDELLGASGAIVTAGPMVVLILEPATEGRLAACLARHGEGLCAIYIAAEAASVRARATALGRPGVVRDGPRYGPYVVEVAGGTG